MNHPSLLCSFCRHGILHLRLDEEFQNVVVFLALVNVATVGCVSTPGLGVQHQVTVVEAPLCGLIHDMEPGPRLHHPACTILSLVLLLQVLHKKKKTVSKLWTDVGVLLCAESHLIFSPQVVPFLGDLL